MISNEGAHVQAMMHPEHSWKGLINWDKVRCPLAWVNSSPSICSPRSHEWRFASMLNSGIWDWFCAYGPKWISGCGHSSFLGILQLLSSCNKNQIERQAWLRSASRQSKAKAWSDLCSWWTRTTKHHLVWFSPGGNSWCQHYWTTFSGCCMLWAWIARDFGGNRSSLCEFRAKTEILRKWPTKWWLTRRVHCS